MKLLVTGGAGFIGSNFVRYMLKKHLDYDIVVLDKLTYAGQLENLRDLMDRITFVKGDICNNSDVKKAGICDVIINFAAESHVDRSIVDSTAFVKTNILGTHALLEFARKQGIKKYIQISTDEVYGSIEHGSFSEADRLSPASPYAASKAGADLLTMAYYKTYGLPVIITRSSNNFGPYQYPEKLIPLLIVNALHGKPLPIYGDGLNVRDWLFVTDNCSALDLIIGEGKPGEIYNIASGDETKNIEICQFILRKLGKSEDLIKFVTDRPAHDRRYSMNCHKIMELGWKPEQDFKFALEKTIQWYLDNELWWQPLIQE